jgi:aspartate aminotransferase-like enzyme
MTVVPTSQQSVARPAAASVLSPIRLGPYLLKVAETPAELEEVHKLNYRTFVREIPQHADRGDGRLVDKFHDRNVYFIAIREGRVVGMVSAHGRPPFSIAEKLADPSVLARLGEKLIEVRLLAVEPEERSSMVFAGLGWCLHRYAQRSGGTHLVISGISDRRRLYERLGFSAIGPAVQSGAAWFIPMAKRVGEEPEALASVINKMEVRVRPKGRGQLVRFTPGPVQVSHEVRRAFRLPVRGHRTPPFLKLFEDTRARLRDLTGGADVALFCGSGTLANDAVAANLGAERNLGPGVVMVNGEFGERLTRHAERAGLKFKAVTSGWGERWDVLALERELKAGAKWVWGVHLESSTGVLNDLPGLIAMGAEHGARICADCVSSIGAVPINLRGVHMASGAAGKCLGAYAGVSFVMADRKGLESVDHARVAASLDVAGAIDAKGPRFTFPSPPVVALHAALGAYEGAEAARERYEQYAKLGKVVRAGLRKIGMAPMAAEEVAAPVITTFVCPKGMESAKLVAFCRSRGFDIGGESEYLRKRGWAQVATMGAVVEGDVRDFLAVMARA